MNWQSRHIVLGRTRCGKTQLSRTIQKFYPRVIVIDTVNDYAGDPSFEHFEDFRAFGLRMVEAQKLSQFRIRFGFSIHDENKDEIANEIFRLIFSVGHVLVVVDECQYYRNCHYLRELVLVGARHGIALLISTQRPANLSKDHISMASDVYVGQLFEPNDVKYLSDFLPQDACEAIPSMPPYHFLHFQSGKPHRIIKNT